MDVAAHKSKHCMDVNDVPGRMRIRNAAGRPLQRLSRRCSP